MAPDPDIEKVMEQTHFDGSEREASKLVDHLLERLGTNVAFGEPVKVDGTTIISVAEIRSGLGFGFGGGRLSKKTAAETQTPEEGHGGGSGAGLKVSPVGYIHISNDKAWFEPIYNINKIILAGIGFGSLLTLMIARLLKD